MVKLDIRINGESVDSLSMIVERSRAELKGKDIIARLRKAIRRQQYEVTFSAGVEDGQQLIGCVLV